MKDLVVSFDIDQVEVDSATTAIAELNRRKQTAYKVSDLTMHWGMVKILEINHPEVKDPISYVIDLWNDPKVIQKAQPVSGAVELSKYLYENDIAAHRITSRPASLKEETIKMNRLNKEKHEKHCLENFERDEYTRLRKKYE